MVRTAKAPQTGSRRSRGELERANELAKLPQELAEIVDELADLTR